MGKNYLSMVLLVILVFTLIFHQAVAQSVANQSSVANLYRIASTAQGGGGAKGDAGIV